MNGYLPAGFIFIALAATSVRAADVARAPVYKAPPAAIQSWSWTGCYLGGYVGGAWGADVTSHDLLSQGGQWPAGYSYHNAGNPPVIPVYGYRLGDSFIGGGTLGCNYQINQWVLGLEGEIGHIRLAGSVIDPNSIPYGSDVTDSTRIGNTYGVIAGRLGTAWDRLLLYVKGGAAFVKVSSAVVDTCDIYPCGTNLITATGSSNRVHWALGGGLEYAVTNNWTVKGEYLWLDLRGSYAVCGPGLGTLVIQPTPSVFCSTHDTRGVHTAKIGLSYKFSSGVPLAAWR